MMHLRYLYRTNLSYLSRVAEARFRILAIHVENRICGLSWAVVVTAEQASFRR